MPASTAIDTADAYAGGESERITGRLIAADRERWVVATKLANPTSNGVNDRGLSRRHMVRALDASLKRLGTDWVDILYLHREDATTPLEETVEAMAHLRATGKVHYFGISNFRAWNTARIAELCRSAGLRPPIVCQPPYNAMTRAIETELLPCCAHYGLGVVAYSPLARGVLSGKYAPGAAPPEGSRAARDDMRIMQTEFRPESLALAQKIVDARALARPDAAAVRARLGLEQRPRARRHRRAEDARAVAGISRRAARSVRRRRRGAGRLAGRAGACVDARAIPIRNTRSQAAGHALAEVPQ